MRTYFITVAIVVLASVGGLSATADLQRVNSILELTPLFMPQAVQLSALPDDVTLPAGVSGDIGYGVIPLNGQGFPLLVVRPKDDTEAVQLYVRRAPDSAFLPVPWTETFTSGQHVAEFAVDVSYTAGVEPYELFAIWDPAYPGVLVYARDNYRTGEVTLNGEKYKIAIVDENTNGRYDDLDKGTLFIDTDRDGKLLTTRDSHERFSLAEPFNINGKVYAVESISADGAHIVIDRSDEWVPVKVPLVIGYPAPDFSGTTEAGKKISLTGFTGKVVVLDFWASWCVPCVAALPQVKALAAEYKRQGVVVLGINLDRTEDTFAEAVARYKLDYPQIYDGSAGPIAALYRITAIPMSYLIDRTGKIAAKSLRGEPLRKAVESLISPQG